MIHFNGERFLGPYPDAEGDACERGEIKPHSASDS
jgi:hypothetical protein